MSTKQTLHALALLCLLAGLSCQRSRPPAPPGWTTYVSPDGGVTFQHPENLKISHVPTQEVPGWNTALLMSDSDESLLIILLLKQSTAKSEDWPAETLDRSMRRGDTEILGARSDIKAGAARGYRQEFREMVQEAKFEMIEVAVESPPQCAHLSAGYRLGRIEQRRTCELILESLKVGGD